MPRRKRLLVVEDNAAEQRQILADLLGGSDIDRWSRRHWNRGPHGREGG